MAGITDNDFERKQSGGRLNEMDLNTGSLYNAMNDPDTQSLKDYLPTSSGLKNKIRLTRNEILKKSFLQRSSQRDFEEKPFDAQENTFNFKQMQIVLEQTRQNAQEVSKNIT